MQRPDSESMLQAFSTAFMPTLIVGLLIYLYCCLMLAILARKTKPPGPWLAWIPFINFLLVLRIARRPWL